MGKLLTVYRVLPENDIYNESVSKVMLIMSKMIKDIRLKAPELADYSLYDIGLKQSSERIDLRFYFTNDKNHQNTQ